MRIITRLTGSVAFTGSIPVEVLMKSEPAIIATTAAFATLPIEPSWPVPRMVFKE